MSVFEIPDISVMNVQMNGPTDSREDGGGILSVGDIESIGD